MKKFFSLVILAVLVISFTGESSAMHGAWREVQEDAGQIEYRQVQVDGYDPHILWAPRPNPERERANMLEWVQELENKEAAGTIGVWEQYELDDMRGFLGLNDEEELFQVDAPLAGL